jgi:hypothetical protein
MKSKLIYNTTYVSLTKTNENKMTSENKVEYNNEYILSRIEEQQNLKKKIYYRRIEDYRTIIK